MEVGQRVVGACLLACLWKGAVRSNASEHRLMRQMVPASYMISWGSSWRATPITTNGGDTTERGWVITHGRQGESTAAGLRGAASTS